MRYLRSLADKDIALDRSMIPLGSCTMKLNAAAEMEPITWPEFARQHPFAPASDTPGLRKLIADLETWLTRDHRIRRGVAAAQRRFAGGVRRAAGHPGLSRRARRARPRRLPDPVQRARHQRGVGGAGRHAGRRGGVPRQRRRRPRRSARQGGRARGSVVRVDDYLSVDPRRVRARHRRHLRGGARRRRPGLRRRRQPQRAGRPGPARAGSAATSATSICTRRSAFRTAAAVPASGRSRCVRTWRRTCPVIRWPTNCPTSTRCRRRRTGRRRSCRSPGPTSG